MGSGEAQGSVKGCFPLFSYSVIEIYSVPICIIKVIILTTGVIVKLNAFNTNLNNSNSNIK